MDPPGFLAPVQRFHARSDFSDFVVKTKERDFLLHRVVMCSQSEYFEKICTSNFQVTPDELSEQMANLTGFLGAIEKAAVQQETGPCGPEHGVGYTLANWYWDSHRAGVHDRQGYADVTQAAAQHAMITSAQMYIMGERFLIPGLKVLALKHFGAAVTIVEVQRAGYTRVQWGAPWKWDFGVLSGLVDNVYSNTTQNDLAFKEPLCRFLAPLLMKGVTENKKDMRFFQAVMTNHWDFTRGLMRYSSMTTIQNPSRFLWDAKYDQSLPPDLSIDGYCPQCGRDTDHGPKNCEASKEACEVHTESSLVHPGWGDVYVWSDWRDAIHWTCLDCLNKFCPNQKYNFTKPKTLEWMRAEREAIAEECRED
ncbi:hypothetical protein PgNI_06453 [Pyricularia grisea]|uniref:BTB domain-containing protein n=1 Tax=Pyricularia grisea TaxID=148305 RepID=A0A6P8B7H9_PYRGI|nr:hypothetical protein PgNI_06453 [Pyricularia grisea]TLD11281.1 hypothetical protein PgNI_06453 [Pyricularia grisea]